MRLLPFSLVQPIWLPCRGGNQAPRPLGSRSGHLQASICRMALRRDLSRLPVQGQEGVGSAAFAPARSMGPLAICHWIQSGRIHILLTTYPLSAVAPPIRPNAIQPVGLPSPPPYADLDPPVPICLRTSRAFGPPHAWDMEGTHPSDTRGTARVTPFGLSHWAPRERGGALPR